MDAKENKDYKKKKEHENVHTWQHSQELLIRMIFFQLEQLLACIRLKKKDFSSVSSGKSIRPRAVFPKLSPIFDLVRKYCAVSGGGVAHRAVTVCVKKWQEKRLDKMKTKNSSDVVG